MIDFSKHSTALEMLWTTQDVNKDVRDLSVQQEDFLYKEGGQWERRVYDTLTAEKRPMYTIDLVSPVIDQIMAKVDDNDFDIVVRPAGGDATKEVANTYNGMLRNIDALSDSDEIDSSVARTVVESGIDGCRILQKFVDSDSFDQDLAVEPIGNFKSRVWFDVNAIKQDMSDAEFCYVLTLMGTDAYEQEYPKGSTNGVDENRWGPSYWYKKEGVIVGEILYKKERTRTLVQMNNGRVYEDNDEFRMMQDEMLATGIEEVSRRERKQNVVYSRLFNGDEWLTDERETVFEFLPVIPAFGNFKISDNKVIHAGLTLRAMDLQRTINYSFSRNVEEGALSPRDKIFMTKKQAAGEKAKYQTMNTNADPVAFWTVDPGTDKPFRMGAPQMNPHLANTFTMASDMINRVLGMFAPNLGDNPGLQSGVAIEKQIDRGDQGTHKWFESIKIYKRHRARILKQAIPKVYVGGRTVRILGIDGTDDYEQLNEEVIDQQTGQKVYLNDLGQGQYDAICKIGPKYTNRQQETVDGMLRLAEIRPQVLDEGEDVLYGNMQFPGAELLAERSRMRMVMSGTIPESQLTDEEKAMVQQQQQQAQQPDPQQQALEALAQAESKKVETQAVDTMSKVEDRTTKNQIEMMKLRLQEKSDQQKTALQMQKQMSESEKRQQDMVKTMAETLKLIREATGADAIVGPGVTESFINQADELNEEIQSQPGPAPIVGAPI